MIGTTGSFRSPRGVEWNGERVPTSPKGIKRVVRFPNGDYEIGLYDPGTDFNVLEFEMSRGLHISEDTETAYFYTNSTTCCGPSLTKKSISTGEAYALAKSMGYKCSPDSNYPGYEGIVRSSRAQFD